MEHQDHCRTVDNSPGHSAEVLAFPTEIATGYLNRMVVPPPPCRILPPLFAPHAANVRRNALAPVPVIPK